MAILNHGPDQFEVRIKRYPDDTYFDEYVKLGDWEKPGAEKCDRYIVAEDGIQYFIELTLRKGFSFVYRPLFYEDAIEEDITLHLENADIVEGGRVRLGARLMFRPLETDDSLVEDTDVMGVDPQHLGHFIIQVHRITWLGKKEQVQYYLERNINDAKMVDEDSSKKDGVKYAIGFIGGLSAEAGSSYTIENHKTDTTFTYDFYYRTTAYLERLNIVKYPPPLYYYPWEQLNTKERKIALKELQGINKEHLREALETRTGRFIIKSGKGRNRDEPKEWRAWGKMDSWEREEAFKTLQDLRKAHERGEVQKQFESRAGEIIYLVDDDSELQGQKETGNRSSSVTIKPKDEDEKVSIADMEPCNYNDAHASDGSTSSTRSQHASIDISFGDVEITSSLEEKSVNVGREPKVPRMNESENTAMQEGAVVKREVIDIDDFEVSPAKRVKPSATSTEDDDDELAKLEEEEKKLAEEIEEAERLAKMKRKREALQAKIEAAKNRRAAN